MPPHSKCNPGAQAGKCTPTLVAAPPTTLSPSTTTSTNTHLSAIKPMRNALSLPRLHLETYQRATKHRVYSGRYSLGVPLRPLPFGPLPPDHLPRTSLILNIFSCIPNSHLTYRIQISILLVWQANNALRSPLINLHYPVVNILQVSRGTLYSLSSPVVYLTPRPD